MACRAGHNLTYGKRVLLAAIAGPVAVGVLYAQAGAVPRPSFEVASVKPSIAPPGSPSGIHTGHGNLDANNVSLQRCIMGAYGVGPHQIVGGPDWLESSTFQIIARADPEEGHAGIRAGSGQERAEAGESPGRRSWNQYVNSNSGVSIDAHHTNMDSFARILARKTDLPGSQSYGVGGDL